MNHSLCWFDESSLKSSLARAGTGSNRISPQAPYSDYRSAQEVLSRAGGEAPTNPAQNLPAPSDQASVPLEDFHCTGDTLDQRLQSFLEWLCRTGHAESAFVADAEGLPLTSQGANDLHPAMTSELLGALAVLYTEIPVEPHVIIRLAEGALDVLWSETRHGQFAVGFLVEQPLSRDHIVAVRKALAEVSSTIGGNK